jgi:hypothetical protein
VQTHSNILPIFSEMSVVWVLIFVVLAVEVLLASFLLLPFTPRFKKRFVEFLTRTIYFTNVRPIIIFFVILCIALFVGEFPLISPEWTQLFSNIGKKCADFLDLVIGAQSRFVSFAECQPRTNCFQAVEARVKYKFNDSEPSAMSILPSLLYFLACEFMYAFRLAINDSVSFHLNTILQRN